MIKRIFILSILIVFAAYLVVAVTALNGKPKDVACTGMELSIEDDINYGFIDSVEIGKILKRRDLILKENVWATSMCVNLKPLFPKTRLSVRLSAISPREEKSGLIFTSAFRSCAS